MCVIQDLSMVLHVVDIELQQVFDIKTNVFVEVFLVHYMFQKKTFGSCDLERCLWKNYANCSRHAIKHSYAIVYVERSMMQISCANLCILQNDLP